MTHSVYVATFRYDHCRQPRSQALPRASKIVSDKKLGDELGTRLRCRCMTVMQYVVYEHCSIDLSVVCAVGIPSVVLPVAHIDICWAAFHQKLGRCLFCWSLVPHTSVELDLQHRHTLKKQLLSQYKFLSPFP